MKFEWVWHALRGQWSMDFPLFLSSLDSVYLTYFTSNSSLFSSLIYGFFPPLIILNIITHLHEVSACGIFTFFFAFFWVSGLTTNQSIHNRITNLSLTCSCLSLKINRRFKAFWKSLAWESEWVRERKNLLNYSSFCRSILDTYIEMWFLHLPVVGA
jgi:hypothetical protein